MRSAVLAGLVSGAGPAPRLLRVSGRPDLVPADTRLAELTTVESGQWAWERPVVVDTHPGTGALSDGAIAAAQCVVVPVVLGGMELSALDGFLRLRSDFPLLLAPNRFAGRARERRLLRLLWNLSRSYEVEVAPPLGEYPLATSPLSPVGPGADLGAGDTRGASCRRLPGGGGCGPPQGGARAVSSVTTLEVAHA